MASFSREEELKLWEDFVKNNDYKALKKLKYSLRGMIRSIVSKYINKDGSVSEAQILARIDGELPNILRKYNPSSGNQLNTFLYPHIVGHVKNAVKENQLEAHVPRTEAPQVSYYRSGLESARLEYGDNPTDQQILQFAPELNDIAGVQKAKQYHVRTSIGDVMHGTGEGDPVQFKDQFMNHGFTQSSLEASLKLNDVKKTIEDLNPQDKRIVEEYVFNGRHVTDIALSLGVSSSKVRKVIKDWQESVKQKGIV